MSTLTTRVMYRQVMKCDRRLLILSPGDIEVDLDKTVFESVPRVGDWVEIEARYEVDDHSPDLNGKVIDVTRISCLKPYRVTDRISIWDALDENGSINNKVFFDKDSLSCGYLPVVGDQVVAEVIEFGQNKFRWRALKVIPVSLNIQNQLCACLKESHLGLEISCCPLIFNSPGEGLVFEINLNNKSRDVLRLLDIEFCSPDRQISFLALPPESEDILPHSNMRVDMYCSAETMGVTNELLLFNFEGFQVAKYFNVVVSNRGKERSVMLNYSLPANLVAIAFRCLEDDDPPDLDEELAEVKEILSSDLSPMNYQEKFHTLLYVDEIANLLSIKQYDQERVCFKRDGKYLRLEIENLSDRKPGILLGDKIIASDPLKISSQEYEGNVSRIRDNNLYLEFPVHFRDSYKGQEYSIRVEPARSPYLRKHHAIDLVAEQLGMDWLFPTKIDDWGPQVYFVYSHGSLRTLDSKAESTEGERRTGEEGCHVKLQWYNRILNCKQKAAVISVLKGVSRPLPYIIFGPPGTGKTVTVIECILQVVRMIPTCKILVTAPSNNAADLVAMRLLDAAVLKSGDLVRLVSLNYAMKLRTPPSLMPYCVARSFGKKRTVEELELEQRGLTFDSGRCILGHSKITVSTCTCSGGFHAMGFPRGHFTHIFVDEAGQAAEPELMIPVSFLDKVDGMLVLAGDPMQLGPVVLSDTARECGLDESYLERLINKFPYVRDLGKFPDSDGFNTRLVNKLLHNYRSLEVILNLFNTLFYHGELIPTIPNTDSTASRLLNSVTSVLPKTEEGAVPSVVFHGVEGEMCQMPDSKSWFNPQEADQVFWYVRQFLKLGLNSENIGIISPYDTQVKEIRGLLNEADFIAPKVGSVEAFQGREYHVILLSTVRSSQGRLGFVSGRRRLNVAISRPKTLLVIIGNPAILKGDANWRFVINYCIENGAYTGCNFENDKDLCLE